MDALRLLVFAGLIVGGVLASLGKQDKTVTLESAREVWSDVLRDADQIGLEATRMRTSEEVTLGNRLAAGLNGWGREDAKDSAYAASVAASMKPYLRRTAIPYRVHVVESPAINAFALPGGHIYVLRGMMDFLQNEAELAAILGHEMAHVDLRHCVERFQYQHALDKVGAGDVGPAVDLARSLVAIGYSQFQELDADAEGSRIAVEAGYDPRAGAAVFSRLEVSFSETRRQPEATRPLQELSRAMDEALSDYFCTHPKSAERAQRLQMFGGNRFRGRRFYVGTANYQIRSARTAAELSEEWRTF